jgi:hypothetical protein
MQRVENQSLIYSEYTISYDPIKSKYHEKMSPHIYEKYINLLTRINKGDWPVLEEIESISKNISNPVFNSLLFNCYIINGRFQDAYTIAELNFTKFPDYLYARFDQANVFLQKKEFNLIPQLFNFKYDIKQFMPKRNVFHISEVLGFNQIMFKYFFSINEIKRAKIYYKIIRDVDIDKSVSKRIQRILIHNFSCNVLVCILSVIILPFNILITIAKSIIKKP